MTFEEIMRELEALGSEQTRKIYRRHGAGEAVFGVSFADLDKLQKKIKVNHALAQELWASGNYDARNLAVKIADPQQADEVLLDKWAHDLDSQSAAATFSGFVSRTAISLQQNRMLVWLKSDKEWVRYAGWQTLASLALNSKDLPDDFFTLYLETIEKTIHSCSNWSRHGMNHVLICIGLRNAALQAQALAIAGRIGKVKVDHGETNCKTPDAAAYIQKTLEHRAKKSKAAV